LRWKARLAGTRCVDLVGLEPSLAAKRWWAHRTWMDSMRIVIAGVARDDTL
jgi:hypothetical protein